MDSNGTVAAIVVTHNRIEQLRKCLRLLAEQTRHPDETLVFDNVSDDGTAEFLAGLNTRVSVLRPTRNVGGAGGFHLAIAEAWKRGHDWFWLMDDDSAPTADALERLLEPLSDLDPTPLVLASRVLWSGDRSLHPMNQPLPSLDRSALVRGACTGLMPLRASSFVSCLLHRSAVDRYGLPNRNYFVWNDDLEYTARVLRHEHGYWVPASVVFHETPSPHRTGSADPSKFYFEVRNKLLMLRGEAWRPLERPAWVKALAVHTIGFLRLHRFSAEALSAVGRGVRDGLFGRVR